MQVYLAIPNDCPYTPDGKKHKLSAEQSVSSSVSMFVSDDEGTSFSQVSIAACQKPLHFLEGKHSLKKASERVHCSNTLT